MNWVVVLRLMLVLAVAAGGAEEQRSQEAAAGRRGWTMTLSYCRETVTNSGITGTSKFEEEIKKCFANLVTYPPAYPKPTW